jgi:uncharacterized membrane protein
MRPTILAIFLDLTPTSTAMCIAAILLFIIGVWNTRNDIVGARGPEKIITLCNLCCAIPLAVFGALHLFGTQFVAAIVPRYMPWRMFWVYLVGVALIAASLSIASRVAVRWSGLLFGIMMFLFVAMIHLPGAVALRNNRIVWTIVFRESSFGAAGLILAANAKNGWPGQVRTTLIVIGRVLIAITAIFFAIEHFLHPAALPVVPLKREMPAWLPARALIDYVTGAALLVAGLCFLLNRKTRTAATYLAAWILLLLVVIYMPVLITGLSDPRIAVQVEGINYFADTLLFAGTILALASAMPRSLRST